MQQGCGLQVTQKLFGPLWTQWKNDTNALFASLQSALQTAPPPQGILVTLERWLMVLKVTAPGNICTKLSQASCCPCFSMHKGHEVSAPEWPQWERLQGCSCKWSHCVICIMLDDQSTEPVHVLEQLLEPFPIEAAQEPSMIAFKAFNGRSRYRPPFCLISCLKSQTIRSCLHIGAFRP